MIRYKIFKSSVAISIALWFSTINATGQIDSLDLGPPVEKIVIRNTFNGPTIISNQSTNVNDGGQLTFLIAHRFGTFREGAYNFYGLDAAVMRLGFEYGVTDRLTAGIGRFTIGKSFDGYLKYRLITQTKGAPSGNKFFSLTLFASSAFSSERLRALNKVSEKNQFIPNLVYTYQTIISREISSGFSVQLSPTFVHRNQTDLAHQAHDIYALGSAFRVKLRRKLNLIVDYNYVWNKNKISSATLYDPIGAGIEVVTGGHVFKLHVTNSVGIIEKEYLLNTTDDFFKGQIRFGFTLLRSFIIKPKVKGGSIL